MACWICTLGSAYSSTFDENSAIMYFQAFVNGLAMTSAYLRVRHRPPPGRAAGALAGPIVAPDGTGFHRPATISGIFSEIASGASPRSGYRRSRSGGHVEGAPHSKSTATLSLRACGVGPGTTRFSGRRVVRRRPAQPGGRAAAERRAGPREGRPPVLRPP